MKMADDQKKKNNISHLENYRKFLTSYKSVKIPLKRILKHNYNLEKLNLAINRINNIVIHTYQFLKLFCMHSYNTKNMMPQIDADFIKIIFKTIGTKQKSGKPPIDNPIRTEIADFYKTYYKPLMVAENDLTYTNLNNVLEYEAVGILTNITNHISEHFADCFKRYINVRLNVKWNEDTIKNCDSATQSVKKQMLALYRKRIRKLKNDILYGYSKCNDDDNITKDDIIRNILPNLQGQSLMTMLNDDPLKLLPCMIKMSLKIETYDILPSFNKSMMANTIIPEITLHQTNQIVSEISIHPLDVTKMSIFKTLQKQKTFVCFPLRKSNIPHYIKLDTLTIVLLLFGEERSKREYTVNGLKENEKYLWKLFFRTELKCFKKKKYSFAHSILTDGVGCTLLFIRSDIYKTDKRTMVRTVSKPHNYAETRYVNDLTESEKEIYKKKRLIGCDPGKEDLIYMTDANTKVKVTNNHSVKYKTPTFRYSQNQVRHEMKIKKFRKNIQKYKNIIRINGMTVDEIENGLSKYDSKSVNFEKIKNYIREKNKVNNLLCEYYKGEIFRNQKWHSYVNRQKSEANMINRFKDKFGSSDEVVILIGDWSEGKSMKGKEPTKGKSIRRLFNKNHFKIFLVNEYNTSKKSFIDGSDMEKFRKRVDPRPWKKDSIKLVHGLLRSKNDTTTVNPKKQVLMNRDFNGSMNILIKGRHILNNYKLPKHLRRC